MNLDFDQVQIDDAEENAESTLRSEINDAILRQNLDK